MGDTPQHLEVVRRVDPLLAALDALAPDRAMPLGNPRYHPSAPGSAPYSTISVRNRSTSASVMPPCRRALSNGPPAAAAASSGRNGSWNSPMYHDLSPCREVVIAAMKAAGCGTDTAVRDRTRSGRLAATSQATAAPQS